MPRTDVIDLSHHNTVNIGFSPIAHSGVRGVIHKLTDGTNFVDPKVEARYILADEAGMLWGIYHFLRPGDPEAQAKFFHSMSKGICNENTLVAVDYEIDAIPLENLRQFLISAETLFKRPLVIYSGHTLREKLREPDPFFNAHRLWHAQYGDTPTLPAGWTQPWLWQFSDKGNGYGIGPTFDCNQASDLENLSKQWSGIASVTNPIPVEPEVPTLIEDYTFDASELERWPVTLSLPGGAVLRLDLLSSTD